MVTAKKDDSLKQLAESFLSGNTEDVVDAMTFITSPWGLNVTPRPVQGFVVKAFYGLELDDKNKTIVVPNVVNDKVLYRFTETEFLDWLWNEGRINTTELSGKNFRQLILVAGRRGGKCRYEKDIVATTKGSMEFGELLCRKQKNERVGIITYDPRYLKRNITYDFSIWHNGIRACRRIQTKRGIAEISSLNHPYLVWRDDWEEPQFVKLSDVKIGDKIAVAKENSLFGEGNVGIDKAKLLGYLQGDGATTESATFVSASKRQAAEFGKLITVNFPKYHLKIYNRKNYCNHYQVVKDSGKKAQDGSRDNLFVKWLKRHDCHGHKAVEKRVPKCILRGSRGEISAFLSRLFACDGWATVEKVARKSHSLSKVSVGYCSSSYRLIDDVRHLLLKFGIHSILRPKKTKCNGKSFDSYFLEIQSSDSIITFAREIGIYTKEKALQKVLSVVSKRVLSKNEFFSVPRGIWKYIKKVQKRKGLTNADVHGFHGHYQQEKLRLGYSPSRRKVAMYGQNLGDKFVYSFGTSDVYWDKVKKIEDVGELPTIDLNVKGTHIIGGDLLSHNSSLCSWISDYELYKLLKRGDPSKYYGFQPESKIAVMNVAPTDEQAQILFGMAQNAATSCSFFRGRIKNATQQYFNLQTDADLKSTKAKKPASLVAIAGGCASNGLRGHNAICVIMDEMAFFISNAGRFSGQEIYKALTPSTATFRQDGKVICISSPYAKYGAFWDRYVQSYEETDVTLMMKFYSALMNPEVDSVLLKTERRRNNHQFMCEYGGEFSDNIVAWIEDEDAFRKCITIKNPPTRGVPGTEYFMGIDMGLKNDGTAITIVHRDRKSKKVILDYAEVFYSASSDVWDSERTLYKDCGRMSNRDILSVEEVAKEIQELCKWWPCKSGWFDQWNGYSLLEILHNMNLKQFRMESVTDKLNNDMYQIVKMLYMDGLVELFDHPVLVPELLSLEAEKKSRNKILVRAPNKRGAHDDISDAFVRAVYEVYNTTRERPEYVSLGISRDGSTYGGMGATAKNATMSTFRMDRMRKHGEIEKRKIPDKIKHLARSRVRISR